MVAALHQIRTRLMYANYSYSTKQIKIIKKLFETVHNFHSENVTYQNNGIAPITVPDIQPNMITKMAIRFVIQRL